MSIRLLMFFLVAGSIAGAQHRILQLEIGDPARKGRDAPLVLDAITDSATGELLTPPALARRLAGVRLLFIGESHTSTGFHAAQHRILEELHRAGRKVLIGLEMYPYTEQVHLDRWCRGLLTEQGFIDLSRWY